MHGNQSLVQVDWIGKEVRILSARNPAYLGIAGMVIDETGHFLAIQVPGKVVRVAKKDCLFQLSWNSRKFSVKGRLVVAAPEERLKIKV
jgi:RNase P/RNase MRP subunit p29